MVKPIYSNDFCDKTNYISPQLSTFLTTNLYPQTTVHTFPLGKINRQRHILPTAHLASPESPYSSGAGSRGPPLSYSELTSAAAGNRSLSLEFSKIRPDKHRSDLTPQGSREREACQLSEVLTFLYCGIFFFEMKMILLWTQAGFFLGGT